MLLMLRWPPEAALEARKTVVRPSRLRFAEHLRMRTLGVSSQAFRMDAVGAVPPLMLDSVGHGG
jgi:hypothetical protein